MDLLLFDAVPLPPEMDVMLFSRTSFFLRLSRSSLALTSAALTRVRDLERDLLWSRCEPCSLRFLEFESPLSSESCPDSSSVSWPLGFCKSYASC